MNAIHALYQLSYSPKNFATQKKGKRYTHCSFIRLKINTFYIQLQGDLMLKITSFKILALCILFTATNLFCGVRAKINSCNNEKEYNLTLEIDVPENDFLYTDYLTITIDDPQISISSWETKTRVIQHFDPAFNETKKAFNQNTQLTMSLSSPNFNVIEQANLHVSYYLKSNNKVAVEVLPLNFQQTIHDNSLETQVDIPEEEGIQPTQNEQPVVAQNSQPKDKVSWLNWITNTVEHSDSLIVQIFLVFLLGLFMSLTPCIYPMVPITAGILQSQGSKSIIMSFFLALSYTCGIATTFAILGLLAAFAGQAMGQLMYHPAFIIPLVALLVYLAFSMIGLYDMYVPRFLQPKDHKVNGGSFISVFAFGAISGIVASPCLSPGLVCLLCIVSTLGSKLLGFILLFAFGVGLSVPLLLIGTFSSSLSLLPRAGMWMVEVKKIFGFVMLGMCFYFLDPILPWIAKAILIPLFVATLGLYYIYHARFAHSRPFRFISNLIGILLIATSVLISVQYYFAGQYLQENIDTFWNTNYESALQQAQKSHKPLFVDIGAPYCSICKSIDKNLFKNIHVRVALKTETIPAKIDGSAPENAELIKRFNVIGFPTILLINPETQEIIKKWGPELDEMQDHEFVEHLYNALK